MISKILDSAHRRTAVAVGTLATLAASPVSAAPANPRTMLTQMGTESGMSTLDLPIMIGRFIQTVITLLGIVLVVLIIYAGFLWMMAQDNTKDIDKAKAIIKNAVIGLVLLLAAYSITNFVLSSILTGTGTATG